jgi:hypothetical protein
MMATRTSIMSASLGAVLLIAPPLVWQHSQPAGSVGDVPTPVAVAEAELEPAADGHDRRTAAHPHEDVEPDGPADMPVPTGLRIQALGVDAPVDPVGLEDDGGMEIPEDVRRVGWYEPGVAPGEEGSAVISGHVDSRTQGAGALFDLASIDVDEEIVVTSDQGDQRWRVVARRSYTKQALPIDELFSWEGPPRLVIITCGGAFDAAAGAYEENVVVHAVPA